MVKQSGQTAKETVVVFERLLPGPIERVWDFLTKGEHLAQWYGGSPMKYEIEPREGGAVNLGNGHVRGVVTQWQPLKRLTHTWNLFSENETESRFPESYVSFELQAQGNDVLLKLSHRPILEGFEGFTQMGWHSFLDLLGALARGEPLEPVDGLMRRNGAQYGVHKMPHES